MRRATARAHANIALVKYWGKRDEALNLPAASSLSVTLDGLTTTTTVSFGKKDQDSLTINDAPVDGTALGKVTRVLDIVRGMAGMSDCATVSSTNSFPTGAGLASSASSMAALAMAASQAAGLSLTLQELCPIARMGSGSATRSLFGGYVVWDAGIQDDGSDCVARALFPPDHWDLRVLVAVISGAPKSVGSTEGMNLTRDTSPYYASYLATVANDIEEATRAIADRYIVLLGQVAERSCLRMHASMMGADPPLMYLQPATWRVLDWVRALRDEGLPVFFTVDAGPNVKVFCEPHVQDAVHERLAECSDIEQVICARPGGGARLIENE